MIADRFEDITHPDLIQQDPKTDRSITLYGYLRGTHLKPEMKIHVAGAGDFSMKSITAMPDPCPLPAKSQEKRHLSDKEVLLYAPMSDVGNIMYDKDAMYINIGQVNYTRNESNGGELINEEGENVPMTKSSGEGDRINAMSV